MPLIKIIELVGTSTKSWEDAVQSIISEASESIRHITGVDVIHQTASVDEGQITEFRATVHVAFRVEPHQRSTQRQLCQKALETLRCKELPQKNELNVSGK